MKRILLLITLFSSIAFAKTDESMKKIIEVECMKVAKKQMDNNPEIALKAKAEGSYDQVMYGQFTFCMDYMKEHYTTSLPTTEKTK